MAGDYAVLVNASDVRKSLRAFNRDLEKSVRKEMRVIARDARDDIRAGWPRGPAAGGHSFRAVTSGSRGVIPYVKLNRGYRPYVNWLVFGGKRPRDRRARVVPKGGLYFYPGVARTRPEASKRALRALDRAVRRAGLD